MACLLTQGFSVDCKDSIGGLREVYLMQDYVQNIRQSAQFDASNSSSMTPTGGFSNWVGADGSTAVATCFKYKLRPGASNLTTTINSDSANGTTFFTQTLSLTLPKLTVAETNEIKLICQNKVQVWVRDNNNNMFLIGMDFGCEATGGTVVTGAARGDMSGFTLTLVGEELEPMVWIPTSTDDNLPSVLKAPFNGLTDADDLTVTA